MGELPLIKNVVDSYGLCGTLIKTRHKKFGEHWYLIVKCPGKYFADRVKFAKVSDGSVMDWDSMKKDEVMETRELIV